MDEINSLILHGCKLARDLETNLPSFANQPDILSKTCDEILRVFGSAKDRLSNSTQASTSHGQSADQEPQKEELGGGVMQPMQEWYWRYGSSMPAMDLLQAQSSARKSADESLPEGRVMGSTGVVVMERREEVAARHQWSTGFIGFQPTEVRNAFSGRGASTSQRPRRRKEETDKWTVRVAAPRMGNTEIPPEDGYTWRKYGQKEILGSRFPRGYYRCTHQKLYQCPAKKLIQRLDNDPSTFEVTYRGKHICHMFPTAPSAPPISSETAQLAMTSVITTQMSPPPPSSATGGWLSMDITSTGEGTSTTFTEPQLMQLYREFGMSTGGAGFSGAGGQSSTVRYGRDADIPVADMADVMFNSGDSSNDSMDLMFSSMEDKWGSEDKKS